PREKRVWIIFRPDHPFLEVPLRNVAVWPVVLPPEQVGLVSGVPVLLADALEKGRNKDVIPARPQIDTIGVTRRRVADDHPVAWIRSRVVTIRNDTVSVNVSQLDVSGKDLAPRG